jgi:hypothetical protein
MALNAKIIFSTTGFHGSDLTKHNAKAGFFRPELSVHFLVSIAGTLEVNACGRIARKILF